MCFRWFPRAAAVIQRRVTYDVMAYKPEGGVTSLYPEVVSTQQVGAYNCELDGKLR